MTDNKFQDLAEMDKKIPRDLIMSYQGKPYILKAGLEWKANYLFGGGNYGVSTDIVEKTTDTVLAKATLKTRDGVEFSNYGEASKANVSNPAMQKYMLHLAITRAECRVLRMATACGYTSWDEMDMEGERTKQTPVLPTGTEPATPEQIKVLQGMGKEIKEGMTQQEAMEVIYAK